MSDMVPFDYSALNKETRGKLIWFTSEIKKLGEARTKSGMEIGKILSEAKEMLDDDTCFAEWVQSEFGISKSSAYNAITAHKNFGDFPSSWKIEDSAMAVLAPNLEATRTAKKMAAAGKFVTKKIALQLVGKKAPATPRIAAQPIEEGEFTVVTTATEAPQEDSPQAPAPPAPPKKGKAPPIDRGKCPNCRNDKWTEGDDGWACSKCHHPHGVETGGPDENQVSRRRGLTIKTVEAAMREFDDLQALSFNSRHGEAIRMCKALLTIAKEWS